MSPISHTPKDTAHFRSPQEDELSEDSVSTHHGAASQSIVQVQTADIMRAKMFGDFFEYHLPPDATASHGRTSSYLRAVLEHPNPSRLLQRGIETVCLGSAASRQNDPGLLHAAQKSYSQILAMLQSAVAASSWQRGGITDVRELLTSISLLTHLDGPLVDSNDPCDSWATHLEGASQVLAVVGPSCFENASTLDCGLARHILSNGNILAVAKRKAWPFMDRWYENPERLGSTGWAEMGQIFGPLPGLLEQTDKALAASPRPDLAHLSRILQQLSAIKYRGLMLWPEEEPEANVSVTDLHEWDLTIEEHRFATSSRSIPHFFPRQEELASIRLTHRTGYLTVLECTILRIWHYAPSLLPSRKRLRQAESQVFGFALKLCQMLLQVTSSRAIVYALGYRIFLKLSRNVFEQLGATTELSWCNACLIANKMRIKRLKETEPPTLCRVEEVLNGIAEAGRFRSAFRMQAFRINAVGRCPRVHRSVP